MGSQAPEAKVTPERPVDESESSSKSILKEEPQLNTKIGSIDAEKVKKSPSEAPALNSKKEYRPPGLLHVGDLEGTIKKCREQVERIAKDCRAKNRKFRDTEFDLDADTNLCLHYVAEPTGVQRVTDIFDTPHFFNPEGVASSNDIVQGALGDCWFLSALATVSSLPRLIEEICVARDELVGVYGFVFYTDSGWVSVIVDDMLCTNVPQFEQLSESQQALYHDDKAQYNTVARKGGKALTFAKSGSEGETWVPLIEKAYAKLYGNFSHLDGGWTGEAIEDLTGGVATLVLTKDILDPDAFWTEELLKAREDRLFACSFRKLSSLHPRDGGGVLKVQGLFGNHAYSVLRAMECKGKRFVVLRNPWGESEWTGRWADGSKEWTGEWLKILPELGHEFGDDGQFIMEYTDFLQCFTRIDRTTLFDSNWIMASSWVTVPANEVPTPYTYGSVSFIIWIPEKTKTFIYLSQLNERFFETIPSHSRFSIGFVIVKAGDTMPLDESVHSKPFHRSVDAELELDAGTYFIYVKVDHVQGIPASVGDDDEKGKKKRVYMDSRWLGKVAAAKVLGQSVSTNYKAGGASVFLPDTLDQVIQRDISFMSKHNGRPRRAHKKQTFLRKLFGLGRPKPATQVQTSTNGPKDMVMCAGLRDETATHVTLGLKVYTRSDTPVVIQARIKGEF
ncbi:hypothetical protein DFP72DRAFT_1177801 [Ephemerocybe angulata]|uniref:Calpain catalytic domain-containing protein n=1 Tax=Ephemerocybe angulata TaxID=980116 RepID=A0A8H6HAS7_9AGAR|nr:hypothetical protein DFP72DRAFT_1177801 [Tulosesus angulatus]